MSEPAYARAGVFTISLDFELIWGTLDKPKWRSMRAICQEEREDIIGSLLALFHEYSVSATWCTVGHLFLAGCRRDRGYAHPEVRRPRLGGDPRFEHDPCTSEAESPLFYGRSLVLQIMRCPTPQEIGAHSFSHLIFPSSTRETANSELKAFEAAASQLGIRAESFVFPRNQVAHLDLLPRYGFRVFRGPGTDWHQRVAKRGLRHRLSHLSDVLLASTPATVLPEWNQAGLWDVPGSMLYTPSFGLRRFIPASLRVMRARKGLAEAAKTRRIFHLWFHPCDVVVRKKAMLGGLRQILETAAELRAKRELVILPMGRVPGYYENLGKVEGEEVLC